MSRVGFQKYHRKWAEHLLLHENPDENENRILELHEELDHIWHNELTEEEKEMISGSAGPEDQKTYETSVVVNEDGQMLITIPSEALARLGWKPGDTLSIDETQISWDDMEGEGLVLSKPKT